MDKYFYKKGGLLVLSAITALLMGFMALASSKRSITPESVRADNVVPTEILYPTDYNNEGTFQDVDYLEDNLEMIDRDVMRPSL